VIGPAFGRTGTMSCKAALERLGFGPCYHMIEVREAPGHVDAWAGAINGAPTDWAGLFAGYRAVVDWPACAFWKEIWAAHPEAKIVLTRRDPGGWFDSIEQTIFQALRAPSPDEELVRWRVQTRKLIFEQTFGDDLSRDHCISVLRAHEADVIRSVPAERLLVFELGDGWVPLCAFLGVAVPDEPFPHANSAAEFRVWTGLDASG
jgi:Sulfotransferase domain